MRLYPIDSSVWLNKTNTRNADARNTEISNSLYSLKVYNIT